MSPPDSPTTEAALPAVGAPAPWYNNDTEPSAYTSDVVGLQRRLDETPDDQYVRSLLVDAHMDAGDDTGADFWRWWNQDDRSADRFSGFHFFDNNLCPADKSRYRIPDAVAEVFHHEVVRYPKVIDGRVVSAADGEPILRLGFEGRILAETTLLAGWRHLTPNERAAILDGKYDYIDPTRPWSQG